MVLKKIHKKNTEGVKKSKTTLFLLPLLQLDWFELQENGFVNAYLGDDDYEIICDNHLFLLFNPYKFTVGFENFCQKLRDNPLFSLEYDCPNYENGKVMFVFGIPSEYQHILPNFKKGEYSKMDKRYVNKFFPKYIDSKVSIRWKVFYKDPSLKAFWEEKLAVEIAADKELWDIPEANEEVLNYNKQETKYW
jgi:hypothetical protein